MANPKTVLILGGGVGGVVAATQLRKALPRQHRVVLVEREASFVFAPSLLWLMTGIVPLSKSPGLWLGSKNAVSRSYVARSSASIPRSEKSSCPAAL